MSRSNALTRTFVVLGLLTLPISYYVKTSKDVHDQLSTCLSIHSEVGDQNILVKHSNALTSFPQELLLSKSAYVVLFDEASKTIDASLLPEWDHGRLLTTYLRYNMGKFANLPQAWILWLVADRSSKSTFRQEHISQLNFQEGDIVCGEYRVLHRKPNQVELGLSMGQPVSDNYIEGRLMIKMEIDAKTNEATFDTKTFMWRYADSSSIMPLERSLPKWLHELASWSLVEQGVNHLIMSKQAATP